MTVPKTNDRTKSEWQVRGRTWKRVGPYPNTAHTFTYGTVTFFFGTVLGGMILHIVRSCRCSVCDGAFIAENLA